MNQLKSNERRASVAAAMIWVVLGIEVISLFSDIFQYRLLQTAGNGLGLSFEEATFNDTRQRLIAIIYLIVFIISGVTFIQWFRRAYFNLHIKVTNLEYSEGWASAAWFVPVLNLFRPFQIMRELYVKTEKLLSEKTDNYMPGLSITFLGWWWALWIITRVLGQFLFQVTFGAKSIDQLLFATVTSIVVSVAGIPLGLITVKIIRDYAFVEPLLFETDDERQAVFDDIGLVDDGFKL